VTSSSVSATIDRNTAGLPLELLARNSGEQNLSLDGAVEHALSKAESLEDLTRVLFLLLTGGYSVWTDGRLLNIKALVDAVGPLRIVIHPNEHPPPHFHVVADGINASFAIEDCALLNGKIGDRERSLVEYWHRKGRPRLVDVWNKTRPSDCPVGPIKP
jgi:Domain of unknown function (DUF4160)